MESILLFEVFGLTQLPLVVIVQEILSLSRSVLVIYVAELVPDSTLFTIQAYLTVVPVPNVTASKSTGFASHTAWLLAVMVIAGVTMGLTLMVTGLLTDFEADWQAFVEDKMHFMVSLVVKVVSE